MKIVLAVFPVLLTASLWAANPVIETGSSLFQAEGQTFSASEDRFTCERATVYRFSQGPVVGICFEGAVDPNPQSFLVGPDDHVRIGVKPSTGTIQQLVELGGFGEFKQEVRLIPEKGFQITELLAAPYVPNSTDLRPYPFIETDILCEKTTCELAPARCVLHLPKKLYPNSLRKLKAIAGASKKSKGSSEAFDNQVVQLHYEVLIQALGGDSEAKSYLLNRFQFGSNAMISELVGNFQDALKKAQRMKCIGK